MRSNRGGAYQVGGRNNQRYPVGEDDEVMKKVFNVFSSQN